MANRARILMLLGIALLLPTPAFAVPEAGGMSSERQQSLSPDEVLALLVEGNERFASGQALNRDLLGQVGLSASGQYPKASVLGCIDSRVPPELIFDQGIGDLFVARVAGNFVDPEILGSLEFASKVAGSKLILVLGHMGCGAVRGACDGVELGNLTATLAQLEGPVDSVVESGHAGPHDSSNASFVEAVAHQNVRATVAEIRAESPILSELEQDGALRIVGGIYDVATGRVTLLD